VSAARKIAKIASFGMLYGQSAQSLKKFAMPVWEPSAVDRLAALADPEMARRVEEFDEPDLKARRLIARWEKAFHTKQRFR